MDQINVEDYIYSMADEYNIPNVQTRQMRERRTQREVIQVHKRINGEKIAAEVAVGDQKIIQSSVDMLKREIERVIQQMREVEIESLGETIDYRDRHIDCSIHAEIARAQCGNCGYIVELGELPHIVQENHGSVNVENILEQWKKQYLMMYLLERVDRECSCNRNL